MATNVNELSRKETANGQQLLFDCENGSPQASVNGKTRAGRKQQTPPGGTHDAGELVSKLLEVLGPLLMRLEARLCQVEATLLALHEGADAKSLTKEFYSTTEVAKILGKRPYTVREWCRLGRVNGQKAFSGRGLDEEWRISHGELVRIQNEGLLEPKKENQVGSAGRIRRPK